MVNARWGRTFGANLFQAPDLKLDVRLLIPFGSCRSVVLGRVVLGSLVRGGDANFGTANFAKRKWAAIASISSKCPT